MRELRDHFWPKAYIGAGQGILHEFVFRCGAGSYRDAEKHEPAFEVRR